MSLSDTIWDQSLIGIWQKRTSGHTSNWVKNNLDSVTFAGQNNPGFLFSRVIGPGYSSSRGVIGPGLSVTVQYRARVVRHGAGGVPRWCREERCTRGGGYPGSVPCPGVPCPALATLLYSWSWLGVRCYECSAGVLGGKSWARVARRGWAGKPGGQPGPEL